MAIQKHLSQNKNLHCKNGLYVRVTMAACRQSFKIKKNINFIPFEQKYTYINVRKNIKIYTLATVIVYIYTVTVARA